VRYLRKTLATSCVVKVSSFQLRCLPYWDALGRVGHEDRGRTFGGASNICCNSRMRLLDPLTRKVPCTSVAVERINGGKDER